MSSSCAKKLAVTSNTSMPMINYKKYPDEAALACDLETVKCITRNMKLTKGNKEVLTLLNFGNEANLIF